MRNLFVILNTFKSQGRAIDQNALLFPKPRQHLFSKCCKCCNACPRKISSRK